MVIDGYKSQVGRGTAFMARLKKNQITPIISNPGQPNMNPCETVIRELRKKWYRSIFCTNCPRALWNYGIPHFAKLMQLTALNTAYLDGQTPFDKLLGETPDISEYLDFGWYDWVWYKENAGLDAPRLGKFLGIAESASNIMLYYILTKSGNPVIAGIVQRVTELEKQTEANQQRIKEFNDKIMDKFKEGGLSTDEDKPKLEDWADLLEDDEDFAAEFNHLFDNPEVKEADDTFDPDCYAHYINMELTATRSGIENQQYAKVTKCLRDSQEKTIGTANDLPMLDSRIYEVEYIDGQKQAMSLNIIAENMFASVDKEGYRHLLLDSIIGFWKSSKAVEKEDAFVTSSNGTKRQKETTKGIKIHFQWKDGSTTWSKMKDAKDSYPVQLAEFAVANGISGEPAFAWWVPYTIKKKN